MNEDGYAVTNNHVIEGETKIAVVLYQASEGGLTRRRIEDVEIVALKPVRRPGPAEAPAAEGPETQAREPG